MKLLITCVSEEANVGVNIHQRGGLITLSLPSMACEIEDPKKYKNELFHKVQSKLGSCDFSQMTVHTGHYRRDFIFIIQYLLCRVRTGDRQIKMNASMLSWMIEKQIQEVRAEYESESLTLKALFSHITKGDKE